MYDVAVIGAGPAGARVASGLAARGHAVVLLEEHERIGSPVHCTGLVGQEAFEEFGLPRTLILSEAETARFHGAAGQSVAVRSDRIRAAVIDRAALDAWLADRAQAAGADVRTGTRVERVEVDDAGVSVAARGMETPIRARVCVLACGANYRFHKALGLGLPTVFLQSAQLEAPFPRWPSVDVRFGREVAPAGFGWLVPLQRADVPHARIGLMAESDGRSRFAALAERLCAEAGVPASDLPPPRFKMLPLGPVPRTYADRVLAVGDAAGLVKPTTGGGIYYGLLSGDIAAATLAELLPKDRVLASHLRRYEARWRRRLGQEIRIGMAFRRIAAGLNDESIDALIDLARVNGVVPLLQDTASFNWHRKAAVALLGHPEFRRIVFRSWVRSFGAA